METRVNGRPCAHSIPAAERPRLASARLRDRPPHDHAAARGYVIRSGLRRRALLDLGIALLLVVGLVAAALLRRRGRRRLGRVGLYRALVEVLSAALGLPTALRLAALVSRVHVRIGARAGTRRGREPIVGTRRPDILVASVGVGVGVLVRSGVLVRARAGTLTGTSAGACGGCEAVVRSGRSRSFVLIALSRRCVGVRIRSRARTSSRREPIVGPGRTNVLVAGVGIRVLVRARARALTCPGTGALTCS